MHGCFFGEFRFTLTGINWLLLYVVAKKPYMYMFMQMYYL